MGYGLWVSCVVHYGAARTGGPGVDPKPKTHYPPPQASSV